MAILLLELQANHMKRMDWIQVMAWIGMEDNSESALSTKKEAISNATMNLTESSILAQDERWRHA